MASHAKEDMEAAMLTVSVPVDACAHDAVVLLPGLPDQRIRAAGADLLQPLLYGFLSGLRSQHLLVFTYIASWALKTGSLG